MSGWNDIDAYLVARGVRIGPPTIGQTTGGTHTTARSFHYSGMARDYGRDSDRLAIVAALAPLAQGAGAPIRELFYAPTNTFFDEGRPFTPSTKLREGHQTHVHAAIRPDAELGAAPAGTPAGTGPVAVSAPEAPVPVSEPTTPLEGGAAVAGALMRADTWKRAGMVAGGVVLVALALVFLARDALMPIPLPGG